MKPFEEKLRYEYPLTSKSTIMEVGAHKGLYAVAMHERYGCTVIAYEPVGAFFYELAEVAGHRRSVEHFRYKHAGLGRTYRNTEFIVKGEMSGPWADEGKKEMVRILPIGDELEWLRTHPTIGTAVVDLISINCEGGEFELLEAILEQGLATRFLNLCIQFHFIPALNPVDRWRRIREKLAETHTLEFGDPSDQFQCNTWEGWKIK